MHDEGLHGRIHDEEFVCFGGIALLAICVGQGCRNAVDNFIQIFLPFLKTFFCLHKGMPRVHLFHKYSS
jgi:hypothetical protein